jgi:hypothetical protein
MVEIKNEKEVEKNNKVQKEVTNWASEVQSTSKEAGNEERDEDEAGGGEGGVWHVAKRPAEM